MARQAMVFDSLHNMAWGLQIKSLYPKKPTIAQTEISSVKKRYSFSWLQKV